MVSDVVNLLEAVMPTIQSSEFKATCLALMDDVDSMGEIWAVTRNGHPIAELHPNSSGRSTSPFGLHCKLEICGNIIELLTGADWKQLA